MRKTLVILLLTALAAVSVPARANDVLRSRRYVGSVTEASLLCEGAEISYGGACFIVPAGVSTLDLSVVDDIAEAPMGVLVFDSYPQDPGAHVSSVGFCHGTLSSVPVPSWAGSVFVYLGSPPLPFGTGTSDPRFGVGPNDCFGATQGQAITGTVNVTLHS